MHICCYTSFTYAYFTRARVLVETVRRAHPDWAVYAVIVDEPATPADGSLVADMFDGVFTLADLSIPDLRAWLFKHDIVEACTAVKAAALVKLLADYDAVVYLDPDIAVFNPLVDVVTRLADHSVVLTPHQVADNDTLLAISDNESTSLRYGIYNLGFLAVRSDNEGQRFAQWWAKQLHRACYDDIENGIFTDQKYCDLVPALFEMVYILRDPGYNVASWNLSTRKLMIGQDGALTINGVPLRFYHFTKVDGAGDFMVERYAGDNLAVFELWEWYRREIKREERRRLSDTTWHYGRFSDGQPIPRAARLLYRSRKDLMQAFSDPFDAGQGGFLDWLRYERPQLIAGEATQERS
jgi:hypothetical protein